MSEAPQQPSPAPAEQPAGQPVGQPAGRPGRYQRSFAGLIGSMIVLVLAVFVTSKALGAFRDEPEYQPSGIDYEQSVGSLVESGVALTYPEQLPDGWSVNNLTYDPRDESFSLALLTDEEDFAGLYAGHDDLDDLLDEYVDEQTTQRDPVTLTDGAGDQASWQVFTDDGGDTAYAREIGNGRAPLVLLVYGSAPSADLETLVGTLITADPSRVSR